MTCHIDIQIADLKLLGLRLVTATQPRAHAYFMPIRTNTAAYLEGILETVPNQAMQATAATPRS